MDGVLNVRKSAGPTSHDVVDQVRRIFDQKKVGHAGTLDPIATGVLVICLGKATRVVEYLMGTDKEYRARMVLGQSTDTQDSTGAVARECDASDISREALENTVACFVGEIEQIPPMISALKHQGKCLYKLAREGKSVERPARTVQVHSIEVLDFKPGSRAEAELLVGCSSGTYIRTLCADIGDKLGCGAHMSALERTKVGRFLVEESVSIEDLDRARSDSRLESLVTDINEALADLPSAMLEAKNVQGALHGLTVPVAGLNGLGDVVRILSPDGALIGLGKLMEQDDCTVVKPHKVLCANGGE